MSSRNSRSRCRWASPPCYRAHGEPSHVHHRLVGERTPQVPRRAHRRLVLGRHRVRCHASADRVAARAARRRQHVDRSQRGPDQRGDPDRRAQGADARERPAAWREGSADQPRSIGRSTRGSGATARRTCSSGDCRSMSSGFQRRGTRSKSCPDTTGHALHERRIGRATPTVLAFMQGCRHRPRARDPVTDPARGGRRGGGWRQGALRTGRATRGRATPPTTPPTRGGGEVGAGGGKRRFSRTAGS